MAEPLEKQRMSGWMLLLVLLALIVFGTWKLDTELRDIAIYSGWTLALLSLLLASYNLRKKLSSLPIGRAWLWRKAHSFAGWLAMAVFFSHAGFVPPDGLLNLLLWWLYLLVLLTGVAGLWMSLGLPSRIAQGGERLQFERIPHLREAQYRRAEQIILAASADGAGQPLLEFHNRHLRSFLSRPRELVRHCFNHAKLADRLCRDLKNIGRYVGDSARHHAGELEEVIRIKQVLDRQYALQYLLKIWMYFHVTLNFMSWVFIFVHVLASYSFRLEYGL